MKSTAVETAATESTEATSMKTAEPTAETPQPAAERSRAVGTDRETRGQRDTRHKHRSVSFGYDID